MDKDYNVDINVRARYDQVQQLNKTLDETSKKFGDLSGGKVKKELLTAIENSAEPLLEAQKQIDVATKAYEKAQNKYRELIVTGASSAVAKNRSGISVTEKNLDSVIKTIQASDKVRDIVSETTKEYEKRQQFLDNAISSQNKFLSLEQTEFSLIKQQASLIKKPINGLNIADPSALSGKTFELQRKNEVTTTERLAKAWASVRSQLQKIVPLLNRTSKETKKTSTWASKLIGRIRNISIYRAIRSGIKWLTSGVTEGLQGLAQYNEGVNSTMSNITNSLRQIRNTLAISFSLILQALEPVITKISDMIVDLLNSFNLAMAKMRGDTIYDKAKKSADLYSKSAEKARKLSFDTFEVLSGGDNKTNTKDLFYPEQIEKDENATSKFFESIIRAAKEIFDTIKVIASTIAEIIKDLEEAGVFQFIADIIKSVVTGLANVIKCLKNIGALKPLLMGIAAAWLAIKVAAIAAGIASAFAWVMKHPIGGTIAVLSAAATFAGALGWLKGIGDAVNIASGGRFAEGGIPNKSELFWMNENGVPEALINTGGTQTNVINIDQLSEGMRRGFIQAIYDTGLIGAIRENNGATIMVDRDVLGQTVASSAGFRNEVNRRNASLNLR